VAEEMSGLDMRGFNPDNVWMVQDGSKNPPFSGKPCQQLAKFPNKQSHTYTGCIKWKSALASTAFECYWR
jgi:hypothetical protein